MNAAAVLTWVKHPRRLLATAWFVLAAGVLFVCLPQQGLTDDDDFYAPAGESYAGWLGDAVTTPGKAFSKDAVSRAFKPNHEHPTFAKFVMGVSQAVTTKLGLFGRLDGARAGVALMCALLCALLVLLLYDVLGPVYAGVAPLLLLSLPRFFFHSQVATLDVPVATMVVFTAAAFLWAERSRTWVILCGVVFGLATLTKLNAPFAVFPAILYTLMSRSRDLKLVARTGPLVIQPAFKLPAIPHALISMALIGPVVFFLGWPWMWFDTIQRLGDYLKFHLGHYPIYLFYDGVIHHKDIAPWHMPFVMAAGTIPAPLLALGLVGTGLAVGATWRLFTKSRAGQPSPWRDHVLNFVLLQALFAIGIVAFTNVPKYGGEKLFMPFFPLFVVLAAFGLEAAATGLARRLPRAPAPALVVGLAVLCALPGLAGTVRTFGGYGLSYYAEAVGGLRGATARGYERTYYDIADKPLARWLDKNAQGKSIHFEPNHKEYVRTYRWLKRDGVIDDVRLSASFDKADLLVLTHERRWSTYPGLFDRVRGWRVVHEKRIDGVPLYTVYERPR